MTFLALALTYLTVGFVWHLRNKRNAPRYQVMGSPALIIVLWPVALYFRLKMRKDPRRFRVGFAAYDPDHPSSGMPEYSYLASFEAARSFAIDKARQANRNVIISDKAVFERDLLGYRPKEYTISPSGEVKSSSEVLSEKFQA